MSYSLQHLYRVWGWRSRGKRLRSVVVLRLEAKEGGRRKGYIKWPRAVSSLPYGEDLFYRVDLGASVEPVEPVRNAGEQRDRPRPSQWLDLTRFLGFSSVPKPPPVLWAFRDYVLFSCIPIQHLIFPCLLPVCTKEAWPGGKDTLIYGIDVWYIRAMHNSLTEQKLEA